MVNNSSSLECVQCNGCSDPHNGVSNPSTNCTDALDTVSILWHKLINEAYWPLILIMLNRYKCMKTTIRYPGGSFISKQCIVSSVCTEKSFNLANYGFWMNCCNTDGCNSGKIYSANHFTFIFLLALSIICFWIFQT